MNKHWRYGLYLFRHKWFVFLAGTRLRAPLWRLIVHDWSKCLPDEWIAYAKFFYGQEQERDQSTFDRAWLKHQHRQPHHWQHWVVQYDDGEVVALEMPEHFVREMVADWMGAGRVITGRWDVQEWYARNAHKQRLHASTKARVDQVLGNCTGGH